MENKYSEIKELTGKAISLMLGEMEAFERKIAEMDREISGLKRIIAELEGKPLENRRNASDVAPVAVDIPEKNAYTPVESVLTLDVAARAGMVKQQSDVSNSESAVLGEMFVVQEAIGDKVRDRVAWMNDFPGERVEDVNMAVSLNDKLLFIRELFDGDEEQYESIMDRINETTSFEDVLMDIRSVFTEWDEESDTVYRFYMAVRRKFV